jgi:DNA-binding transcriptional LysR family regulator
MPDWTLTRSFLAVAEAGSLSGGARATWDQQPTLGRHIAEMEAALMVCAFHPPAAGAAPDRGRRRRCCPMPAPCGKAAARSGAGRRGPQCARMTGTVRLTASRVVAHHLCRRCWPTCAGEEPGIEIEIVPRTPPKTCFSARRTSRCGCIARRSWIWWRGIWPTCRLRFMPAMTYLDRHGRPQTVEALLELDFIGQDRIGPDHADHGGPWGISRRPQLFPVRCDDPLVYQEMVRAGAGWAACCAGSAMRIRPCWSGSMVCSAAHLPVWLTAAPALRQSPRLRGCGTCACASAFPA